MDRFQIKTQQYFYFQITFKEQMPRFVLPRQKNHFTHINVKSIILLLCMCSTNIGFQPKRINLSRSISSAVHRTEPTTRAEPTKDRTKGLEREQAGQQLSPFRQKQLVGQQLVINSQRKRTQK
jgi:hypothetical protein